ncbi:MAG: UdgX family uracil-DNA binding protein [Acidobacteriota bacterium]
MSSARSERSSLDPDEAAGFAPTFDAWRAVARDLLMRGVAPDSADFRIDGQPSQATLPGLGSSLGGGPRQATDAARIRVQESFVARGTIAACHRDPERWRLFYRLLWRLHHGERALMRLSIDPDVHRLEEMVKAVRRDCHKMKAFVRFRRVERDDQTWYIAWHRPDHFIVERTAPFFVERFSDQRWTILTPDASVSWDLKRLRVGPGAARDAAPNADRLEDLWRTYYASIFNPARVKVRAMKAEMPVRHWATLPETRLIPELLLDAPRRAAEMVSAPGRPTARSVMPWRADGEAPSPPTVAAVADALQSCRACALCETGRPAIAGEGPADAHIVLVGEQPGDVEDRQGRPFVGPAGKVLDDALKRAGLQRQKIYLTNTVKHFKFERRGSRRIHRSPGQIEVSACLPWVQEELAVIQPQVVVCLGATAARALIGGHVRLRRDRGRPVATGATFITLPTYHPSAALRVPADQRATIEEALTADLRRAAALAEPDRRSGAVADYQLEPTKTP